MTFKVRVGLAILLAAGLGGAVLAQPAPSPTITKDLKCLALGSMIKASPTNDDRTKASGNVLQLFYLGRISTAGQKVDLDKAVSAVLEETKAGAGPLYDECMAGFDAGSGLLAAPKTDAAAAAPAPSGTTPAPRTP